MVDEKNGSDVDFEIYEDIRKLKEFILKNSGGFSEVNRSKLRQSWICCFLFITFWWVVIVSFILGIIFFNHCITNTNSVFCHSFASADFMNKSRTSNYLNYPKMQKKNVGMHFKVYGNFRNMKAKDGWGEHKIKSRRRGFGKKCNLCIEEGKTRKGIKYKRTCGHVQRRSFYQKVQYEGVQRKLELLWK